VTPTVHVLLYGRVLCGSIHGLPKDWGPGHKWVGFNDVWRGGWKRWATCAECRCAAERLVEMQQPEAK
jgi:hypothetical protein